jgi:hypothetical protein
MEQEYRDEIIRMVQKVSNLTFLSQIYTLVKRHIERAGD